MIPAHQATVETTDLETRLHAKLMPRKTAAWQRREESLSDMLSGAHGNALKHASGLWEPIIKIYGFSQRSH